MTKNIGELHEKPNVEQMFTLAKACKIIAQTETRNRQGEGRWRASNKDRRVQIFLPRSVFELALTEDDFRYTEHRFTGRLAYRGIHGWSMRMSERYHIRAEDEEAQVAGTQGDGYRATYKFEWTKDAVLVAEKRVHAISVASPDAQIVPDLQSIHSIEEVIQADYVNSAETPVTADFSPVFSSAVREYNRISHADCDALIAGVQNFRAGTVHC